MAPASSRPVTDTRPGSSTSWRTRFSSSVLKRRLLGGLLLEEAAHRLGGPRAALDPILGPLQVDLDDRGAPARVVVSEGLDEASVPPRLGIGHHHAVTGPLG